MLLCGGSSIHGVSVYTSGCVAHVGRAIRTKVRGRRNIELRCPSPMCELALKSFIVLRRGFGFSFGCGRCGRNLNCDGRCVCLNSCGCARRFCANGKRRCLGSAGSRAWKSLLWRWRSIGSTRRSLRARTENYLRLRLFCDNFNAAR